MLYKTLARIGKYAPIIRADDIGQALKLIRRFESFMRSQSIECSIGLAGLVAMHNHSFDVAWSMDYANQGEVNARMITAKQTTKISDKVSGFYKPKTAKKINDVYVVNEELALLFAKLTRGTK